MAYEEALTRISLPAGGDMSTIGQYRFVKLASDGQIDVTSDGDDADGILQDKPAAAGRPGEVAISGVSKIIIGTGGLTAGDDVASGANGTGITAATGDTILGRCIVGGSAGEIGSVLLKLGNAAPVA